MSEKALAGAIRVAPVRKQVRVGVNADRAFDAFCGHFDRWWPRDKHIGKSAIKRAVLEPFAGGRWYEVGEDGSECEWGSVLVWDPPKRLVLAWRIAADFTYDPSLTTTVEVRFTPEGAGTLVELEHRDLELMGTNASKVRELFDSTKGWGAVLGFYAQLAEEISQLAPVEGASSPNQ
jgi:uncharacterized protein YndB with AHSA1/START domain